ncbi:hypothetical protein [Swingsia samuiensis]|uniref:Uncharacterized protein n=1 Tax=Swingsia samuiensis TaxID=1293412 RepID=A0A4Y6ULW8_9PROT|nr:hypothetical protein [Swingsia samuiensis]QDH17780.1 hypothetical protein E3D00_09525 [Swingsia samuiensis]
MKRMQTKHIMFLLLTLFSSVSFPALAETNTKYVVLKTGSDTEYDHCTAHHWYMTFKTGSEESLIPIAEMRFKELVKRWQTDGGPILVDAFAPQNKTLLSRALYLDNRLQEVGVPKAAIWIRTTEKAPQSELAGIIQITFPSEGATCRAHARHELSKFILEHCGSIRERDCKDAVTFLGQSSGDE